MRAGRPVEIYWTKFIPIVLNLPLRLNKLGRTRMPQSSVGPKILFWGTLFVVVTLGTLSFFYIRALNQLQIDSQTISQIRTDYEKRI